MFSELFNLEEIQKIQDSFAKATGVASIITDIEGKPITEPSNFCRLCINHIRQTDKGLTNCMKSDAEIGRYHPSGPIIQPCLSGGLWDAGASITVGNQHIANWLIGQIRTESQNDEKIIAYAREIGADEVSILEAWKDVTIMPLEQFKEVAYALFLMANLMSRVAYQNLQLNELTLNLEKKVAERTAELKKARDALWSEIELAHKIQTSLLPDFGNNFHPSFVIAAEMAPADQVGGDFYDISYDLNKHLWIAIGDVSGHGITPGLIMMMAQTVNSTITANMDCEARDVVAKVNEILYQNVNERLKEKHFMTFTALKYLGDGRFQHAGAHLSLIVFRFKTQTCELIQTKGVYLNFRKDISKVTKNSEFVLDPGDILVLYTDGLTEVLNSQGRMLDIDGFVKIVKRHAHQEPEAMKDMILADVIQWCNDKREDDMTIVIVKRKEGEA